MTFKSLKISQLVRKRRQGEKALLVHYQIKSRHLCLFRCRVRNRGDEALMLRWQSEIMVVVW